MSKSNIMIYKTGLENKYITFIITQLFQEMFWKEAYINQKLDHAKTSCIFTNSPAGWMLASQSQVQ